MTGLGGLLSFIAPSIADIAAKFCHCPAMAGVSKGTPIAETQNFRELMAATPARPLTAWGAAESRS